MQELGKFNLKISVIPNVGFYRYEYMTDFEKFKEQLASEEKFYSSLTNKKINDKEYEDVLNVWNKFEMKPIKDYHDLYLKCDVLLLADVSEKLRNNSLKNYGLYPSHYLSTPGLSWDAMLKMTKIKPELITDPDMYIFFEKGTRGEIPYISNKCSKADSIYLKSYDPKQGSKHIIYLYTSNSDGYAMSKFLATSGFKWIDPEEFDLNKYASNSSKGCVLEVNLEYPKDLRELDNDYPLAPDKIEIKREMLSEYQLKIADLYNIPIGNVKKIVPNFFNKYKYVIPYKNLQL